MYVIRIHTPLRYECMNVCTLSIHFFTVRLYLWYPFICECMEHKILSCDTAEFIVFGMYCVFICVPPHIVYEFSDQFRNKTTWATHIFCRKRKFVFSFRFSGILLTFEKDWTKQENRIKTLVFSFFSLNIHIQIHICTKLLC